MTFVKQFNQTADVLMERLRSLADGKTSVEMLNELNRATLDAIAHVLNSYFKFLLLCMLFKTILFISY
jgi:hypothetical protein